MLGSDMVDMCRHEQIDVDGFDLPEIDITSPKSLKAMIPSSCDWVINCAAYTDVDGAELHPDDAFKLNAEGVRLLAKDCSKKKTGLVHISTDYVFGGNRTHPYTELNRTDPVNMYGASKLAGEKALRAEGCKHLIVRTQSLFGTNGNNFIRKLTQRFKAGKSPSVVTDQVMCPTYTVHLAAAIIKLIEGNRTGIVHVSSSGQCSWYELACALGKEVAPDIMVKPIAADQLSLPAPRPAYSVLDNWRFRTWTGFEMPHWKHGLMEYVEEEGYK